MPDQTVHVVDDDEGVRESLRFLLRSAGIKVEAHESADAMLAALPTIRAGCIVTDIRMPGLSGLELLKHIRALSTPVPVIVITGHGDVPLAVEAMKHGAADFLEKPFDDERLLSSVRAALDGRAQAVRQEADKRAILARAESLTPREHQVLQGMVAGHANKQIAFDLSISPRTVEVYRANVMAKMDAPSLSELVRMAISAGLMKD
jgi:two-component system response regulator FixJ